jgi:hypothetical protein
VLHRMNEIILFPKKRRKQSFAKAIAWPDATADLVRSATTSEVVTR